MFFRRRSRPTRNEPDPLFPGLSQREAEKLRSELREKLIESGATIRFDALRGIIDHPRHGQVTVNLENLVGDVATSQHPKAPRVLSRTFIDSLLEGNRVAGLDTAELYAGLRLRIAPLGGLVTEEADVINSATLYPYTDDTAVTLVLDTERSIQTMPLERLKRIDDLNTLIRAARNNLREELFGAQVRAHVHLGSEERSGARFRSFESDNYYLASAPIFLEEMLEVWAPDMDRSLGVLFAMPTRHILLAREITRGEDLLEGLGRIAPVAAHISNEGPHSVSPLLHMFHNGEVTTLTAFDEEERGIKITPTPYLMELIAGNRST